MDEFRMRVGALLMLTLGVGSASSCASPPPTGTVFASALRSLASAPPVPLDITHDASRVLTKAVGDTDFKLTVVDRRSGATIAEQTLKDSPQAGTLRGDGLAFAYFVDRGGDQRYVPMIAEVGGRTRALNAPPTSAPGTLLWSPDGAQLAYLQLDGTSRARRLMVSNTAPARVRWRALLSDIAPQTSFAWSADSRRLAAVRRARRGSISVVSLDGAVREYVIAPGAEIREVAWMPGERVLATVRRQGQPFFGIVRVDLATGHVQNLVHGPWDASEPHALGDGAHWAFHVNLDSEFAPIVCTEGAGCRSLRLPAGTSHVLGSVPGTDTVLVLRRGRSTPPEVLAADLAEPDRVLPAPSWNARAAPTPSAERMDVRPPDGLRIPMYVWRAPHPRSGVRAAVIRVHGGPAVQADRAWDRTTEYLLQSGIDVVQLNYRGSTGYGAPFERAGGGDCARAGDVAAAVAVAERRLAIPRERIILYGHSYGALLVAKAGRALPDPIGALVLVSMTSDAEGTPCARDGAGSPGWWRSTHVLAYHGVNDYGLSTREARQEVARLHGGSIFQRMRVRWRVFDEEGHTFHRNDTWARVYADIIAAVDEAS